MVPISKSHVPNKKNRDSQVKSRGNFAPAEYRHVQAKARETVSACAVYRPSPQKRSKLPIHCCRLSEPKNALISMSWPRPNKKMPLNFLIAMQLLECARSLMRIQSAGSQPASGGTDSQGRQGNRRRQRRRRDPCQGLRQSWRPGTS